MSKSIYTEDVRRVFKTFKPPHRGFVVDMVEFPEYETLILRVYRDNVESFSDPQKIQLAEYLYKLRDAIRSLGVACNLEGVEKSPPNLRK